MPEHSGIDFRIRPPVSNEELNALFADAWPEHKPGDFGPVLARSLGYVCAYDGEQLIGFVKVAWDGGVHAFLLDPTVHTACRRRGIGLELVSRAASLAREAGATWLHVDFVPELRPFYDKCGFRPTEAGLIDLQA